VHRRFQRRTGIVPDRKPQSFRLPKGTVL
jgi:hypothetical protein